MKLLSVLPPGPQEQNQIYPKKPQNFQKSSPLLQNMCKNLGIVMMFIKPSTTDVKFMGLVPSTEPIWPFSEIAFNLRKSSLFPQH